MTHSEALEVSTQDSYERLDRPDGSVAFEVVGTGPLIVCVPGMGDLRSSYRFVQNQLTAAGYRVALMDLRGHGDSDTTFAEYGDAATAGDIAALIQQLGGPAVVVGNSMAAGASVVLAAEHPELVKGLVLVGPFVREHGASVLTRWFLRALMAPVWAAATWHSYLPKLYAGTKPADFNSYRATLKAALRRPGYAKAFSLTTRISHDVAEAAISSVTAPTLVIMGELDPDFPNPAAEAAWIAGRTRAEILMVPSAGHYPQSQRPDLVGPAIAAFTAQVTSA